MSVMIIDYGMGNLSSVQRALEEVGAAVFISDQASDIKEASSLLLPGVGAFGEGMRNLRDSGMADAILAAVKDDGIPLLGICLGMQLLAEHGEEGGPQEGLGLIPGTIRKLKVNEGERLPHIGWNEVTPSEPHPMFEGIPDGSDFYFVHSYYFDTPTPLATTPFAGGFAASVAKDKVWGAQFHPEKSSKPGLKLLENFVNHA